MSRNSAQLARERRSLTIDQAAKKLRISPDTLKRYESGKGANLYMARKIARLYGCSVFGCFTEQGQAMQGNPCEGNRCKKHH